MQRVKIIGEDLAAVHGYLCADGWVIIHKAGAVHKYYRMAFKNMEPALLEDFVARFERVFLTRPKISKNADLAYIGNRQIFEELTSTFGSFYSYEWKFPELFNTKEMKAIWLRAVFDCEGWVYCKKGIDRHIGLEMVNLAGVLRIQQLLSEFGVIAYFKIKKRGKIFRLNIFGKDNMAQFSRTIGFLHPKKKAKLQEALDSFVDYVWKFPEEKTKLAAFLVEKLGGKRHKIGKRRIRICSCARGNLETLQKELKLLFGVSAVVSKEQTNSRGDSYFELSINRSEGIGKIRQTARI